MSPLTGYLHSMSTHTRARTKRQWRHPASRCRSHKLDKQQGELRKETAWLGVDAPQRPSPQRSFPGLQGHEYTHDGENWHRCQAPEEFADFVEREAARRSWYRSTTTRKGVPVEMLRRVDSPIEVLTTTFAPWLSDWTAAELAGGYDPRPFLGVVRAEFLKAAKMLLAGQRHVLGYAFHCDTDDPHFDLILARQDGDGGRIGEAGLRLVGPWCVGVDRQVRCGAQISPDKCRQLTRSVANFRRRYAGQPDAVPLDVALARALDAATELAVGLDLPPYVKAYAARVPELERQHAAAQLATLQAAEAKLQERAAPPAPDPEREMPGR